MSLLENPKEVKENFYVSRVYGAYYEIYNQSYGTKRATLRGKLRLEKTEDRNPFVVGDKVLAQGKLQTNEEWIILERAERENFLVRKSSFSDKHVLCANVDYVAVIASLADPETKGGFIDRCVAACYEANIKPYIILTKKDLEEEEYTNEKEKYYRGLGYSCLAISVVTGEGLDELKLAFKGKKIFLVGNSGSGKSTLINSILGKELLKTNEISEGTRKGKHTTTNSYLLPFGNSSFLIDSPGVKEWGVLHLDRVTILESFPELLKHKSDCELSNCCEMDQGCIMLTKSEELPPERYDSLQSMLEDAEIPYRIRTGNILKNKVKHFKDQTFNRKKKNKDIGYDFE
ncbi:MAG: ribosome small subunit-dependent GTPase A [Leptospiraceae bacterium]|nr:ribosome small subunit-dependent GTPase A [Leptospiraceae bacterium]